MADKYITTRTGTRRMRQTTVGWSFLVKWGDGSQQWIDLKILKESNAALLGFLVIGGDNQNAYLQAPSSEKHFIVCGPEFGTDNVGRVALIRRALYGGKVAGRDFWHHL